jgi:hypothetical protein
MDTILIKGEPLGAALARLATNECQTPGQMMDHLLVGTPAATFGFTLPLHLGVLAQHLPGKLGATPSWLAENHTFFPAVAPILEESERAALLAAMSDGRRIPALPITFCRKSRHVHNSIRFCPVCAAKDRAEGWGATWRMVHNLFGVTACPFHGCRLVSTGRGFNKDTIVVEADCLIPQELPAPASATEEEVLLAQDLNGVFRPNAPRPGRARLAAALVHAFDDAGMSALTETPAGGRRIMDLVQDHFTESFRQLFDGGGNTRPDSWEICYATRPRIYPLIKMAMLAKIAGTGLPGLLETAAKLPVTALEKYTAVPIPSLAEQSSAAPRLSIAVRRGSRDSIQIPKWAEKDAQLEGEVRRQAHAWRLSNRKHRITSCALARAAQALNWRRPELWATKLPRFHAALREESETPVSQAARVLKVFVDGERGTVRTRQRTAHAVLVAAGFRKIAKDPEVLAVAERLMNPPAGGPADPTATSKGECTEAAA